LPSPLASSLLLARQVVRRIPVAGTAVLVSIAAHVLAAATASAVLPFALRGEGHEVEIEVDLARADLTGPTEVPNVAPPTTPANQTPSTSHKPNHVRTPATQRRNDQSPSSAAPAEASPPSARAAQEPPLHFTLPGGNVATTVSSSSAVSGDGSAASGSGKGNPCSNEVLSEKDVSVAARLISSSPVTYPSGAMRAEVEADVPVQILVDAVGRVLEAGSLTRHGYGLDDAAAQAIRTWRFSPALRDGHPVRVRMRWTVQFRLR
jgi:TonB family protein